MKDLFNVNSPDATGDEGFDPSKSKDMLFEGFMKELNKKKPEVARAIASSDPEVSDKGHLFTAPGNDAVKTDNTEKVLIGLYDVRDDLINTFGNVSSNMALAQSIADNINKVGSCIISLGGEVKKFNPLDHVSKLSTPDLHKNNSLISM